MHSPEQEETLPLPDPIMDSRPGSVLSTRFVAIGVMMTLVVVAGLAGAALERMAHQAPSGYEAGGQGQRPDGGRGRDGGGFRNGGRGGGPRPFQDRLTGDLALTPVQRTSIDSAMAKQLREFEASRKAFQPHLDSILKETRTRIESILTPAQRAALPPAADGAGPDLGPPPFIGRGGPRGGRNGPGGGGGGGPDRRGGHDDRDDRGGGPSAPKRPLPPMR